MNRQELNNFINDLLKARTMLSDEVANTVAHIFPTWSGNFEAYKVGDRVLYNDVLYKVLQDHVSQETWTPESAPSLFAKVLIPNENVVPEWEQPDSTNPYMSGDLVSYKGDIYVSTINNNVWSPETSMWKLANT